MSYFYHRDLLAEVVFLTSEEGGRSTPAFTGYRPQIRYDGEYNWSAIHQFIDTDSVPAGQVARAYLTLASPEAHAGKLHPEMEFELCEGSRIVGRGKIVEILNPEITAEE
jgi:elongation factor Tu